MELCRCCLSQGNIGLNSFSDENIVEIIAFLGIICQNPISNFPRNVCNSCDLKLKDFANFKEQCTQSEEMLRERFEDFDLIKTEDCSESIHSNLQENNKTVTKPKHPIARRNKSSTQTSENNGNKSDVESEIKEDENLEYLEPDIKLEEDSNDSDDGGSKKNGSNEKESSEESSHTNYYALRKSKSHKTMKNPRPKRRKLNYPYLCHICNKGFRIEQRRDVHLRKHEISDPGNSKKLIAKRRRKILTKTYNPRIKHNFPLQCNICNRGFRYQELLDGHLREHDGKSIGTCEFCGNEYNTWSSLRQHVKKCHLDETKYRCDCGKIFLFESSFETHRASHYGAEKYVCETCGKLCRDADKLKTHYLVHTDERPFQCKTCGKAYKSEKHLRAHEFRHTGIRKFACEVCGKPFVSRPELKTHMLVHTSVKAYKCTLCEKDFRYKNQLDVHMRTHTGEKPFKCETCGKAFIQKSALNTHAKTHLRNEEFSI